jgi:hypothetical protein
LRAAGIAVCRFMPVKTIHGLLDCHYTEVLTNTPGRMQTAATPLIAHGRRRRPACAISVRGVDQCSEPRRVAAWPVALRHSAIPADAVANGFEVPTMALHLNASH